MYTKLFEIQKALVPLAKELNSDQKQENLRLINLLLSGRGKSEQKLFLIFVNVVYYSSIFRFLKPFPNLTAKQNNQLLDFFFNCPVGIVRKGFWGLNTICKAGVYGQPSLHSKLNYKLKEPTHGKN